MLEMRGFVDEADRDMREPWERDPDETPAAWAAFVTYRDLDGRRSLRRAAWLHYHGDQEDTDGTPNAAELRRFKEWSRKYDWQVRVEAWDDEKDRRKREAQLKSIEEMAERHAKDAMNLQQIAALPSKLLTEQFRRQGVEEMLMELNDLHLRDRIRLAYLGSRLMPRLQVAERLARGEPTEIVSGEMYVEGEVAHLHGVAVVKRLLASDEGIEALDAIGRIGIGGDTAGGEVVDVGLEGDSPE